MTTFDGTTGGYAPDRSQHYDNDFPAPPSTVEQSEPFDAFESLREQLAERDDEAERTTTVEIPGIGWRLICATDFEYPAYMSWQKAALPKSQRNGRRANPLDMNQAVLAHQVLFNTCEAIEYRVNGGDWQRLTEADGQPTVLQSPTLMTRMGVVDPRVLVRKMFGKDAALIAAGTKVITEAGYGEPDSGSDVEDPTG